MIGWHCPPDTGFEIRALAVWGRARYLSVTEAPHNTNFHTWMGKKQFCFIQTAETGNRTPDSGVKGSGANHYPRAPARSGPGRGLITSLHLICYIWCPTWPDILCIFNPDIMCSCQYCLVRLYAYICTCIMFIDYSTIVVLYKSEDGQKSEDELHGQCWFYVGPAS